jgi:hypothetical protein
MKNVRVTIAYKAKEAEYASDCRSPACSRKGVGVPATIGWTKNRRELHEISTPWGVRKHILNSIMRGAFVVQLRIVGEGIAGRMEGCVEEVDTGKQAHFRSVEELIGFLRQRFAESCQGVSSKEGPKPS